VDPILRLCKSLHNRRRYAREFLEWRFEGKRWDLTMLCFGDFVDYVKFRAPHRLPVGQPMTPERLRGAVRRIMRRGGLTNSGPHRLRHSFATRLHARGASLKEVADVLGHQHFDTAAIYARVNLSQLRKVALPWPRTHPKSILALGRSGSRRSVRH
jgi:integrase